VDRRVRHRNDRQAVDDCVRVSPHFFTRHAAAARRRQLSAFLS
jgi:hypothetical protein